MEKTITYMGQKAKVACDEKCNKAWGIVARPSEQLSDDDDDVVFLSDDELGDAPPHPMFYEGGDGKPVDDNNNPIKDIIPNKWCLRACERCAMSKRGEYDKPLELPDWSKRVYNLAESDPNVSN